MNFKILKTRAFWTRVAIFEFTIVLAILFVPSTTLSGTIKVLLIVLSFPLYFFSETGIGPLLKIRVKQEIQTKLSQVDTLKHLNKSQNLRSNIFLLDKKHKRYYIAESYNMKTDNDRTLAIPENMGCTGEAWRTKMQVWGERDRIFKDGNHRIPEELLKKVKEDLEWICSTPIIKNQNVVAVLNFDGNKPMNEEHRKIIESHANCVASELSEVNL
ncbi:hypothetical protein ES703_97268 [subsurface metagenome]